MIILAIVMVLFAPFLMNTKSAASFNPNYNAQDINLDISETSIQSLNISKDITSFSITGTIKGSGKADVYLQDADNHQLLIYSGTQSQKPASITGFAAKSDTDLFRNVCEETCYFTTENHPYSLYVELDANTSIIINRIVYK